MAFTIPTIASVKRDVMALDPGERLSVIALLALSATLVVAGGIYALAAAGPSIQRAIGGEAFKRDTCAKMFANLIHPDEAIARLGLPPRAPDATYGPIIFYCRTYAKQ